MNKRQRFYLTSFLLCLLAAVAPIKSGGATKTGLYKLQQDDFYIAATKLLQAHVEEGLVNYKALQQEKAKLQRLVQQISSYNLQHAPASERKAFYLNAYNLLVLQQVLAHYPIKSVMEVPGFFDKQLFRVAGEKLTLNQLEKQKLMVPFKDARVHFALVCAAKSCPPLPDRAYIPAQVEEQLEAQAKRALQDPSFIKVRPEEKKVLLSEIFKWYKADFIQQAPSIPAYINRFRSYALPPGYTFRYYTYNWGLNDSSR